MKLAAALAVISALAVGLPFPAQGAPAAARAAPAQSPQQVVSQPIQTPGHDSLPTLTISAGPDQRQQWTMETFRALQHVTVTVHNPQTNTDETYSGVPLIDLLGPLGAPRGAEVRGKALSDYLVATGVDGNRAVLALAEIEPDFHPGQVLIADTLNGEPLDAKTGPFKLVVTEDKFPARSVNRVVSVRLETAGSEAPTGNK